MLIGVTTNIVKVLEFPYLTLLTHPSSLSKCFIYAILVQIYSPICQNIDFKSTKIKSETQFWRLIKKNKLLTVHQEKLTRSSNSSKRTSLGIQILNEPHSGFDYTQTKAILFWGFIFLQQTSLEDRLHQNRINLSPGDRDSSKRTSLGAQLHQNKREPLSWGFRFLWQSLIGVQIHLRDLTWHFATSRNPPIWNRLH